MDQSLHNTKPELLLWKMTVNDDKNAFEKIFRLFYQPLIMYAKKIIEEQPIREDIVQDVFTSLWEDRKKLSITTSLLNYLIAAVRNSCLNYLRKEKLIRQYRESVITNNVNIEEDDEEIYTLKELRDILENTLSKLPENYRIVFEMHHVEGKKYEEIAKALNLSVRTVKRYKEYTINNLKKDLRDYLPLLAVLIAV